MLIQSSARKLGLRADFIQTSQAIARAYLALGVKIKPFASRSLPHFSALPIARQNEVLNRLLVEWALPAENKKDTKSNNANSLWRALRFFGLQAGSHFFGNLRPEHKIEIYSMNGIQIWRNVNVMEICSYTLEEILCHEWYERYERDPKVDEAIFKIVNNLHTLEPEEYFENCIPVHEVTERFSEERLRLSVQHECFFPLFNRHQELAAFAVTSLVEESSRSAEQIPASAKQQVFRLVKPL